MVWSLHSPRGCCAGGSRAACCSRGAGSPALRAHCPQELGGRGPVAARLRCPCFLGVFGNSHHEVLLLLPSCSATASGAGPSTGTSTPCSAPAPFCAPCWLLTGLGPGWVLPWLLASRSSGIVPRPLLGPCVLCAWQTPLNFRVAPTLVSACSLIAFWSRKNPRWFHPPQWRVENGGRGCIHQRVLGPPHLQVSCDQHRRQGSGRAHRAGA